MLTLWFIQRFVSEYWFLKFGWISIFLFTPLFLLLTHDTFVVCLRTVWDFVFFTVSFTSVPWISQLHHLYTEYTHSCYHHCFPYCVISWPLHKHLPLPPCCFHRSRSAVASATQGTYITAHNQGEKKEKSILVWCPGRGRKTTQSLLHPVPPTIRSDGVRPVRQRIRAQWNPSAVWISQDISGTQKKTAEKSWNNLPA